jgi:hypothetical protein
MHRMLTFVVAGIVGMLLATPALANRRHAHPFVFLQESFRLPPNTEPAGTSTTGVNLVDVDDDGDLDIFLAEGTAAIDPRPKVLLINDGCGFFTDESAARLPPSNAGSNTAKAAFGDVDGDGDMDAVLANVLGDQLFLNDGTGHFTDASGNLPGPNGFDISAGVTLVDVNDDGDLDIIMSQENPFDPSPTGGAPDRIWINDGTGHFNDETVVRLPTAPDQTGANLPGDIDGDGDVDIIVLNRGQERVLINDGDGFFTDETATRFPVTADSSRGGQLADLDGDGDLDLIVANSRSQPIAIYYNDGHGHFTAGNFGIAPVADETDTELLLADLDEDGDLDVFWVNAGKFDGVHDFEGGKDRYARNNGDRTFTERGQINFPFLATDPSTAAAFGDLDDDGDLDLVVGNSGANGGERIYIDYSRHINPIHFLICLIKHH